MKFNLMVVFVLLIGIISSDDEEVRICFPTDGVYKDYFPPEFELANPADIIYSVSNKQKISRPVIVYLCTSNGAAIQSWHPLYSTKENRTFFKVASVNREYIPQRADEEPSTDVTSSVQQLKFCQFAANYIPLSDPRRYDVSAGHFNTVCSIQGTGESTLHLPDIPIIGSYLVVQGIYHEVQTEAHGFLARGFEFSLVKQPSIKAMTYNVKVYTHTATVKWLDQHFKHSAHGMAANRPFYMSLEIVDENKRRITQGLDSTLIVQVTLAYQSKSFLEEKMVEDFVYKAKAFLSGEGVITSYYNYDRVLHKRAAKGLVEFKNVVIQDEYRINKLKFNATLIVPRSGKRQPEEYDDLDLRCRDYSGTSSVLKIYTIKTNCPKKVASVTHSSEFLNYAQEPAKLLLVEQRGPLGLNHDHEDEMDDVPNDGDGYVDEWKTSQVSRNFKIPGLWIVLVDEFNRRIYSGPNAKLPVTVETIPRKICISEDQPLLLNRGLAKYQGSICDVHQDVKFVFGITIDKTGKQLKTNESKAFNITGNIKIALFGRFNTAGHKADPDPLIETFARFAVEELTGKYLRNKFPSLKKGRWNLSLNIYDTEHDFHKSTSMFTEMMAESEANPEEEVRGIIGFGSNIVTRRMRALLSMHNLPVVTYRETWKEFIRVETYLMMVSISWNELSYLMHLAQYFAQRGWNKIIIIDDEDINIEQPLISYLASVRIEIALHLHVGKKTDLSNEMRRLKQAKTLIVLCQVYAPQQYKVLREAIRHNVSCLDGYQWVSLELPAKQFDWDDEHPLCAMKPTCTEAFQGMMLIDSAYNLSGCSSSLWYNINRRFYGMNPALYRGVPTLRGYAAVTQIVMGFDTVLTYANAFENLLRRKKTISPMDISEFIHKHKFEGLTGTVQFSETTGRRIGCTMSIRQVVPRSHWGSGHFQGTAQTRWLAMEKDFLSPMLEENRRKRSVSDTTSKITFYNFTGHRWILEVPSETPNPYPAKLYPTPYLNMWLPNQTHVVQRYYLSTRGFIDESIRFRSNVYTKNLDEVCLRTDVVIVAYYCGQGCGGKQLHSWNAIEYTQGRCTAQDECKCLTVGEVNASIKGTEAQKAGFTGEFCQTTVCGTCRYGYCAAPYKCICNSGWTGINCSIPICTGGCVHGVCVGPDHCECAIGYQGNRCQILLGLLVMLCVIGIFLAVIIILLFLRWIRKKRHERELMENLDWLVDWKDVKERSTAAATTPDTSVAVSESVGPMQPLSRATPPFDTKTRATTTTVSSYIEDTVEWKGIICYAKKFNRDSLDVNSVNIRQEIVLLKEMRHPNLVLFVGACLTTPEVALLVELVPKGSLNDILQSEAYNLTWAFKFSILRDIALGMEYIHNSKLGSHGRLKSTNCLIDNRWTCKIAGFGVQIMRKIMYSVENLEQIHRSMLWTAPELLRTCITPSEVDKGTKVGDVYSFGIIISEVCTHDLPFYFELQILSVEELFRILKNFHDPANRGIKKLLDMNNYDTSKPIRPALVDTHLPEVYSEKKGIQKLIVEATAEDPNQRPSFKEILNAINSLHPLKGELIENLIYMLEKYTNHLEEILNDKMREVQSEKNKTEDLIARLLPPTIAERLKLNREVAPEMHNNVTILFSDVVGFTAIAKEMQPMEVVELLNDLYTSFDSIIESFNVYKLETIGDAYCVASGVPTPYEKHYEDIATMALYLLAATDSFPLRNMPQKKLQIRIGIHSGSCVAGVVGVKMPRYCIFGEDVTIAQYMESHGEPNAVQVSATTASLLEGVGSYYLLYRTELDVKFIGNIETYWLIGKEGFDKELPYGTPRMTPREASQDSSIPSTRLSVGERISVQDSKSQTTLSDDGRRAKRSASTTGDYTLYKEPLSQENLDDELLKSVEAEILEGEILKSESERTIVIEDDEIGE